MRDWRDLSRPGGIRALVVLPVIATGQGFRLGDPYVHNDADGFLRHFRAWPLEATLTAICKQGCDGDPPRGYGGCACGVWAYMRRDEALGAALYEVMGEVVARALLLVRLRGDIYPLQGPRYDSPLLVKASSAEIERIYLHADALLGFCGPACRLPIAEIAEDLRAYPVPVEVRHLTLEDLPTEDGWDHPEAVPRGIGWRVVADDYSSPMSNDGSGLFPVVFTPPGADVVDDHGAGFFVSRHPVWLAHAVAGKFWLTARMLAVSFDEADVVAPWDFLDELHRERDHEIVIRRIRVIGELEPSEIAMLASGIDPAPILARVVFDCLVRELDGCDAGMHGVSHWRRVAENGRTLAAATPGADPVVVAAFAALHDAFRLDDGGDSQHGKRAADIACRMRAEGVLPLDEKQLETLSAALVGHDRGQVSDDPTVAVCWDADRLELGRVGVEPRAAFMSTFEAKRLAA